MNKALRASVPVLFSILAFGASAPSALAATINVSSDATNASYYNAVVKAADHLLSQQNLDGGWSWYGTSGTPSDVNLWGVTGLGLLNAYQLTHKTAYLDGASSTAAFLLNKQTPTDLTTDNANKFYSSDIEFLAKMAQVTGNTAYSDKANALMAHFMSQPNRYCATGCATAQNIADAYHGWYPTPSGVGEWQISGWVKAAKLTGQTSWGSDLATIVKTDVLDPSYASTTLRLAQDTYYALGIASALDSTALFSIGNADIKAKLLAEQDGTTGAITANSSDGVKQTTAYSVLGLSAAGDSSHAATSANFLVVNQNSNGGWTESDTHEYTEVNSEIIQAIFSVLPSNTFYTIQDAFDVATSSDTINIGAGTFKESNFDINKSINLIGAGESNTFIAPAIIGGAHAHASAGFNDAFRLHADNVSIKNLTIDGNLNGGTLDFHNGIIQDATTTNNLTVQNVTIKNVWWRGINMRGATGGGTGHLIDHLTVSGVSGVPAGDVDREQNIGVVFFGPSTAEVKNSTFSNAGTGLATGGDPINTINWHDNTVSNVDEMAYEPLVVGPGSFFTNNTATFTTVGNHAVGIEPGYSTTLNITNTKITGAKFGAKVEVQTLPNVITDLVFGAGTVFTGPGVSTAGSVGIFGKDKDTSGGAVTSFTIDGASVTGYETGVAAVLTSGGPSVINIRHAGISGNGTGLLVNPNTSFTATDNWWGNLTGPTVASNPNGTGDTISTTTVPYSPWYIDAGRAALNTDMVGTDIKVSGNFTPASTATGTVGLPTGTSDLTMSSGSVLDLSTGTSTATGGNITIGGTTQSLSSFSSGDITTANLTAPLAVGSTTVTVAQAVKLSSGTSTPIVITNTALPNVSASIPDGTTILAPAGWTGTIAPPTTTTGSGDAPSGFSVGGNVIDVGSSGAVLLFDKPVTLTLAGVTGTIGYKPAGTTSWTKITASCGTDYNNPAAPAFPGECAISNGTDTKILTYHFTTFGGLSVVPPTISPDSAVFHGSVNVTMSNPSGLPIHYTTDSSTPTCSSATYTGTLTFNGAVILKAVSCDGTTASAVASANFSSSGGGNGGSSGGGGGSIAATPATPAVPGVSPAVSATPATPAAKGKVLGAEAYNFTKDLHMGSSGADVTELQKLVIAEGFDIPAITKGGMAYGYFGGQTLSAVIAYQKAHGVSPAKGYVSTLTRAELNKGTVASTTPETPVAKGKTNLTASQVNSILSVLQSFGVDQATMDKVKAALGQ